jgi:hypothetical protein
MEIVVRLSVTPTGSESGQTFSKKVPESQLVQHSAIRSALISRSRFIFAIIGAVVHEVPTPDFVQPHCPCG